MKKALLLGAALLAAATSFAQDVTYYIIGSNVNGKSWALKEADAAFTAKGDGVFEWTGTELGTGFKINDGTWGDLNWGSGGEKCIPGEPYYYLADKKSGNIDFEGVTLVKNPVVTLNTNDGTLTVTGEGEGAYNWYFVGDFNGWSAPGTVEADMMKEVGDNVFENTFTIPADKTKGNMQVSQNGWTNKYGLAEKDSFTITAATNQVDVVQNNDNSIPYELEAGEYTATFDYLNQTLKVVGNGASVATFEVENGVATFYDLNGARIANPAKGIYVKVVNGKAVKAVVK